MKSEACEEGRHGDCGVFVTYLEHDGSQEEDNCSCGCHDPYPKDLLRRVSEAISTAEDGHLHWDTKARAALAAVNLSPLVNAALKLADAHDETVDGEWGSGYGDTVTDEADAVREAAAPFIPEKS